jgi:chromosome segregation ATPase
MFDFWPKKKTVDKLIDNVNTTCSGFTWIPEDSAKKDAVIINLREQQEFLYKENQELKDLLKSIEEDGTEEHNAAVDLRQENVHLRIMVDTWKELNDQKAITIDELEKENVELMERVNEIDSDVNRDLKDEVFCLKNDYAVLRANHQIVQNNYKKCTEQRDEFKHQLNASNKEIEALKKEKKESFEIFKKAIEDESARFYKLVVEDTNNWINLKAANKEIEALKSKVRDWEDKYAKNFSYRDMDKLQKTIDEQKKEIQKLKGDIVDYVIEKDDKLEEAKAVIEALKGMKTQGFEDYDSKDFVEQKHPMYPLHWGILQKAKDLTEGVEVDLNKPLDEQCPCNKCKAKRESKHESSWEEAASDLALRVAKLEEQL